MNLFAGSNNTPSMKTRLIWANSVTRISTSKSLLFGSLFVISSWGVPYFNSDSLLMGQIAKPEISAQTTKAKEPSQKAISQSASRQNVLQPALDSITETKVKETVSYLASDELAGRATLSEGFDTAAEYVAKRFSDAGLKPVDGDSFFSITEIPTTATPKDGLKVLLAGNAIDAAKLLSGGPEIVDGTFECRSVELRDDFEDSFDGIAVIDAPQDAGGRRWLAQLARLANRIGRAGGAALVIRATNDSPLQLSIKEMQRPHKKEPRLTFMIPVIVAPTSLAFEGKSLKIQVPQQIEAEGKAKNVLAMLPGSDPELAKEFVLFSAHLDHLPPKDSGDDRIFNGADDNATGVTAVICLAEAFAKLEKAPKRSVLFMTFWGEESGLLGSKAFADNPGVELSQIKANINIEMIGRPEAGAREKVWVTGWEKSDLGQLMVPGAAEVGVEVFEHPQFSAMLYARSDNYSLAAKGVIAHSFSAGSLHADYHQPSDEWEKLDLAHMKSVISGLLAGAFPIANGDVTPKPAE